MRISVKEIKKLVQSTLNEADECLFEPKVGDIVETIRDVRITPKAVPKSPGEFVPGEWEGGEAGPRARRAARPRGVTVTIIPPGTQFKDLKASKNWVTVEPVEPMFDERTGEDVDAVFMHVNKFCPVRARQYTGAAQTAEGDKEARATDLRQKMELMRKQLEELEGGSQMSLFGDDE